MKKLHDILLMRFKFLNWILFEIFQNQQCKICGRTLKFSSFSVLKMIFLMCLKFKSIRKKISI